MSSWTNDTENSSTYANETAAESSAYDAVISYDDSTIMYDGNTSTYANDSEGGGSYTNEAEV